MQDEAILSLYANRTTGGYRHHRSAYVNLDAVTEQGQRSGKGYRVSK